MPLENLEGDSVFINALVATNPTGTDYPFPDGDNHIRGIKKVLKNTFPNFDSQITRSSADIQRGSVPAGAVMVFFMTAAPLGWVRSPNITTTYALRIVPTTSSGGISGGTDDPVLNNKVPSHSHSVPAVNTGGENVGHQHYSDFMTGAADRSLGHNTGGFNTNHQHLYTRPGGTIGGINLAGGGGQTVCIGGLVEAWTSEANLNHHHFTSGVDHLHRVAGWTGERNQGHLHGVPAHNTNTNASAANWAPRYVDMILCVKS